MELSTMDTLLAQNTTMSQQITFLTKQLGQRQVSAVDAQVLICELRGGSHKTNQWGILPYTTSIPHGSGGAGVSDPQGRVIHPSLTRSTSTTHFPHSNSIILHRRNSSFSTPTDVVLFPTTTTLPQGCGSSLAPAPTATASSSIYPTTDLWYWRTFRATT
ncbi:hypothetical protein PIB30_051822 [Stylosanthes scabra]|uniref:Uncharacterized protein n=1 Tax=Stylosanthes scabra TaxID=79078 RepID=A0ABU6WLE5_9FABA|nr:hypothetical protein [Stylosanthes scabra]